MTRIELLYEKVMLRMDMTKETGEEELQEIIRCVIDEEGKREFLSLGEKIKISRAKCSPLTPRRTPYWFRAAI